MKKQKPHLSPTESQKPTLSIRKRLTPKTLLYIAIAVLLLLSAAGTVAYVRQYTQPSEKQELAAAQRELETVVGAVEKLILLPEEIPSIATVTDKSVLNSQPFFSKAENGDKVLLFTASQKAILYRPSTNKIIEVAPINTTDQAAAQTQETQGAQENETTGDSQNDTEIPQITPVSIINGSSNSNAPNDTERQLEQANLPIRIIEKAPAIKQDYPETLVIDVSGNNSELAATIARTLNAKIDALPEGELPPSTTEILVIVGQSE